MITQTQRILFFFVLPILAYLSYAPESLAAGATLLPFVVLLFVGLGWLLWRGKSLALTLSIFLQGLNVIVRLLMLFPHAQQQGGGWDVAFIFANLLGLAISFYLMLRLDQPDVRVGMAS